MDLTLIPLRSAAKRSAARGREPTLGSHSQVFRGAATAAVALEAATCAESRPGASVVVWCRIESMLIKHAWQDACALKGSNWTSWGQPDSHSAVRLPKNRS